MLAWSASTRCEPANLVGALVAERRILGEAEEGVRVGGHRPVCFGPEEESPGVLGHRFQHVESAFTGSASLDDDQGLLDQHLEQSKDLPGREHAAARGDLLDHGQRRTTTEHGEQPEQALLLRCQQAVAPVECGPHGLLSARQITGCRRCELLEPVEQCLRGQQPQVRRRQLDRQR